MPMDTGPTRPKPPEALVLPSSPDILAGPATKPASVDNINMDTEEEIASPTPTAPLITLLEPITLPLKRPAVAIPSFLQNTRKAPSKNHFGFTALPSSTKTPLANTAKEALQIAQNLVVQACNLTTAPEEQTKLLDLLEVFRDFTEMEDSTSMASLP
ncbi:hypothetical protein EJ04DRAFT_571066 [Polyplosphaeria fusca]|uniref:Uncharacterized protein n=1 Tax=Polyplosphaeria fusca TaxID=682080 RepID=A0A9P4UVA8_9PLEO|nr:hypothetical protein EJ04DRAFT_571066 [Polyplosphaeria fusca]